MEKIRLGYIGCGFMAQKVHIPNLTSIPDCELIALAEVRSELGAKVQKRFGIPQLYEDHHALAQNADIEAVAVSADFALQGEIAKDLLLAGKHVFMEKPMAVSLAQAEAIVDASRTSGKKLMVGYMKRYDAGNEIVKARIGQFRESGELGRLTYARNHGFGGDWVCNLDTQMDSTDEPKPSAPVITPEWLPEQYRRSYLGYLQQYTHNINLMRWFLDAGDDVSVTAVDLDANGYTGVVLFNMGGIRVTLETGHVSHYRWDEHSQLYFENGWVHTWAPPLLLKNTPAEVEIYRAGQEQEITRPIPKPTWTWAYRREMEYFVANVRSPEPFRSSAEDTLTDVRLFEDIYRIFVAQQN